MNDDDTLPQGARKDERASKTKSREERLAQALRENLRRRKAQARARKNDACGDGEKSEE